MSLKINSLRPASASNTAYQIPAKQCLALLSNA